ncbi:FecR family protein [Thalassospira alkalitolerans]|uniref:FecR family protein n=1 Tax=Thalassospira alkalitolerans TaxID=1293890 RepID=UPI003AA80F6D
MAGTTDPIRAKASKEATDWLILLQDAPDDRDIQTQFATWRDRDPVNAQAWDATVKAADMMAGVLPIYADRWQPAVAGMRAKNGDGVGDGSAQRVGADHVVDQTQNQARPASSFVRSSTAPSRRLPVARRIGRRQLVGFGGMAIAASLLAFVMAPKIATTLQADYSTATAEVRTITLADASTVTLAPESAIRVRFDTGMRHIDLLEGEAFFDVTPNRERPFRVSSDAVDVTVLGTGFDVRREPGGTDVTVEHGLVRVDLDGAMPPVSELLEVGQTARVTWQGNVTRNDVPVGQVAAWRQAQLIAQDQPLGSVVDQLRRYYGGTIIVTDGGLAARPVTGVYNLADPVAALRGIARAQNGVVRQITPWVLVVSAS